MSELNSLRKELDSYDNLWSKYGCDCFGFFIKNIESKIKEILTSKKSRQK